MRRPETQMGVGYGRAERYGRVERWGDGREVDLGATTTAHKADCVHPVSNGMIHRAPNQVEVHFFNHMIIH